MKVVASIEPPQRDVIEKILRHCGLWHPSALRAPPADGGPVHDPDGDWDSQKAPRQVGKMLEVRVLSAEGLAARRGLRVMSRTS